jgi:hypothetical protein
MQGRTPGYLALVIATAGIAGATVAIDLGDTLSGSVPAMGRTLVGLFGLAAAALMWSNPLRGWHWARLWAWIQIPYFAWSLAGSPTAQILSFPLTFSGSTTVNGELASYMAVGINLVGVGFAIWLAASRDAFYVARRDHQPA